MGGKNLRLVVELSGFWGSQGGSSAKLLKFAGMLPVARQHAYLFSSSCLFLRNCKNIWRERGITIDRHIIEKQRDNKLHQQSTPKSTPFEN
jgi:hypothetical protein